MHWLAQLKTALLRGIHVLSPNCREATRLQSEALDRRLPVFKRLGLKFHLLLCQWCRRYGEQIAFLRSATRHPSHDEQELPPQELSAEARERIKRRLQSDGK